MPTRIARILVIGGASLLLVMGVPAQEDAGEDDLLEIDDEWVDVDFFFEPWEGEPWHEERIEYEEFPEREHFDREFYGWGDEEAAGWDYEPAWSDWPDEFEPQEEIEDGGYGFYEHVIEWDIEDEEAQLFDGWVEEESSP